MKEFDCIGPWLALSWLLNDVLSTPSSMTPFPFKATSSKTSSTLGISTEKTCSTVLDVPFPG